MRKLKGFISLEGPRLAGTQIRIPNRDPELNLSCHPERFGLAQRKLRRGVWHRERDASRSRPDVSTPSRTKPSPFAALFSGPRVGALVPDSARHDRRRVLLNRRGFTLIELLVVIAIIALLIAILLPALQRINKQAKAFVCRANLKQWGTIMTMYTEDNEGHFPSGDFIWFLRGSYLTDDDDKNKPHPVYHNISTEGIACCPMAVRTRDKPTVYRGRGAQWWFEGTSGSTFKAWEFTTPPPPFRCSYGPNLWLFIGNPFIGGPFHNSDYLDTLHVKGRANIPVLLDSKYYNGSISLIHGPPPTEIYKRVFIEVDLPEHNFCINRHDGYINGLFLDWSVRKVGLKELWTLKWHNGWDTDGPWTKAGGVRPEDWPKWMRNFKDY